MNCELELSSVLETMVLDAPSLDHALISVLAEGCLTKKRLFDHRAEEW
jgi:hypothetical protein